jgi:hypothetical protein
MTKEILSDIFAIGGEGELGRLNDIFRLRSLLSRSDTYRYDQRVSCHIHLPTFRSIIMSAPRHIESSRRKRSASNSWEAFDYDRDSFMRSLSSHAHTDSMSDQQVTSSGGFNNALVPDRSHHSPCDQGSSGVPAGRYDTTGDILTTSCLFTGSDDSDCRQSLQYSVYANSVMLPSIAPVVLNPSRSLQPDSSLVVQGSPYPYVSDQNLNSGIGADITSHGSGHTMTRMSGWDPYQQETAFVTNPFMTTKVNQVSGPGLCNGHSPMTPVPTPALGAAQWWPCVPEVPSHSMSLSQPFLYNERSPYNWERGSTPYDALTARVPTSTLTTASTLSVTTQLPSNRSSGARTKSKPKMDLDIDLDNATVMTDARVRQNYGIVFWVRISSRKRQPAVEVRLDGAIRISDKIMKLKGLKEYVTACRPYLSRLSNILESGDELPRLIADFHDRLTNDPGLGQFLSFGYLTFLAKKFEPLSRTLTEYAEQGKLEAKWAVVDLHKQWMDCLRSRLHAIDLAYDLKKKWGCQQLSLLPDTWSAAKSKMIRS